MSQTEQATTSDTQKRRAYVSQEDIPAFRLDEALRVPQAIADNHAFSETRPLEVAAALGLQPGSSTFRMLTGAAIAYGLTDGGYNATAIKVMPLARRIIGAATAEQRRSAEIEALLKPRIIREFLTRYDANKFPRDDSALGVLKSMGVPADACQRALKLVKDEANRLQLFEEIKGAVYVNLKRNSAAYIQDSATADAAGNAPLEEEPPRGSEMQAGRSSSTEPSRSGPQPNRRVFITHGKSHALLAPLKELLSFGELEPVVSVERESVAQPVPDKVLADMRSCGAAIIHVDSEGCLLDPDGASTPSLNPNVLIEIGAAMALYGRRFILLVRDGVQLPSNLQGLYEVRYSEDRLDGETTIRLLKAIRELKNHPLP